MPKLSMLPSIDLLSIGKKINIIIDLNGQKNKLIKILKDFDLDIEIINIQQGPVVTLYSVKIPSGVKANKIINLSSDIARLMESFSARISAIPGKNLIGIELANKQRQSVYFKEGMMSASMREFEGYLPLYLGCDIYGEHKIFDLSQMPHLLVAGTTGSGKSIGIHTMILSLLMNLSYEDLRIILIDPKKLELIVYEDLPHLLFPVITEAKVALNIMKWAVKEMEERYKLLASKNVRNIFSYNKNNKEKMQFLVIIIDELADLMLLTGKEFDIYIQRLAQMGRACGIHLVLATQRPSVDVITGTIKANFPTRISYKLASKLDSRVIFADHSGAEQLLGLGDMLYLGTNGQLSRIHGSYVSEDDVIKIVEFWKSKSAPNYMEIAKIEEEFDENDSEYQENEDKYYQEAKKIIKLEQKVSASFLQRNFPIGYNRAASIIERMEKEGLITKGDSFGRNREILY